MSKRLKGCTMQAVPASQHSKRSKQAAIIASCGVQCSLETKTRYLRGYSETWKLLKIIPCPGCSGPFPPTCPHVSVAINRTFCVFFLSCLSLQRQCLAASPTGLPSYYIRPVGPFQDFHIQQQERVASFELGSDRQSTPSPRHSSTCALFHTSQPSLAHRHSDFLNWSLEVPEHELSGGSLLRVPDLLDAQTYDGYQQNRQKRIGLYKLWEDLT